MALILASSILALSSCADQGQDAQLAQAAERTSLLAGAEWIYDHLVVPQGDECPQLQDRCRVVMPGAPLGQDVACGLLFLGLDDGAELAPLRQLLDDLGGTIVEHPGTPAPAGSGARHPRWIVASVPVGQEPQVIRRALSSDGVRFVDVGMHPVE